MFRGKSYKLNAVTGLVQECKMFFFFCTRFQQYWRNRFLGLVLEISVYYYESYLPSMREWERNINHFLPQHEKAPVNTTSVQRIFSQGETKLGLKDRWFAPRPVGQGCGGRGSFPWVIKYFNPYLSRCIFRPLFN